MRVEMTDDDYRSFECEECEEWVTVERGTWAEENDMCEPCWCIQQGG